MDFVLQQVSALPKDVVRLLVWLILLAVIFIPLERFFALHRRSPIRKGTVRDLGYYFLSSLLPKLLLVFPLSVLAWVLHRAIPGSYYAFAATVPVWIRLTVATVVGEVGAYWGHRWEHENPFLWRFHAIHHSAEEIDWLTHTHAHPLDLAFVRLCAYVPLYLLGLMQPSGEQLDSGPLLAAIIGTIWGFFIHANLNWRFGWLEWIIATPAFHHWHHTNDGPDVINKNYAPTWPLVDKLFGTLYLPAQWPARYGIDRPENTNMGDELMEPFGVSNTE